MGAMSVLHGLVLAARYVLRHRTRSSLLALALGLTLALPLAVRSMVEIAQHELRSRAETTPLVLGAKGSAIELTLNALYFRRRGVETIPAREGDAVRETRLGSVIPLLVRHHSQEAPIVGTSLDYFPFRRLRVAQGAMITRLGDCVVGAKLARERGLHAGGSLTSSPEQVFDLAGTYPLKMRITGVLAENHSADDLAIFVDVKTAWLIEGIAHGHEDVVKGADPAAVLERSGANVAVTNAVRMFNEVTDTNIGTFHFHGDAGAFPLTAALIVPRDAKGQALLLARFQGVAAAVQLVQPAEQMDALLTTLFQAERLALLLLVVLGAAVLFIAALVFALSFKMRRREFATLEDIGVARGTVALVKFFEVLLVGAGSAGVVLALAWLVQAGGASVVRALLE
jgi:putative ABC transport system permease protein